MNDWNKLTNLCKYLEKCEKELNDEILKTQTEVMKLQDILDSISPVPVSEPKEEVRVIHPNANRKVFRGFDYKNVQPVVEQPKEEMYMDFLDLLDQYKAMPKFDRSHLADRFTKRLMDYSRMTAAHLYDRMCPLVKILNNKLDNILDADISQDNIRFRARYSTNWAIKVDKEFERLYVELGLNRKTDVLAREKVPEEKKPQKEKKNTESPFEILANLTPKQLNSLYKLRGDARRNLMSSIMKERAESAFLPFLKNYDTQSSDEETKSFLNAAKKGFLILSHDPKSYALVLNRS